MPRSGDFVCYRRQSFATTVAEHNADDHRPCTMILNRFHALIGAFHLLAFIPQLLPLLSILCDRRGPQSHHYRKSTRPPSRTREYADYHGSTWVLMGRKNGRRTHSLQSSTGVAE